MAGEEAVAKSPAAGAEGPELKREGAPVAGATGSGRQVRDSGEIDVLIVGAGPTGLTAAAQLAERGISCRLIEKLPVADAHSRALVVQARTLELLAKMGLAAPLIALGRKGLRANLYIGATRAAELDFGNLGVDDTAYPYVLFVSQAETERVLTGHLERCGVAVERSVELVGLTQDAGGVTASLRRAGGPAEQVRAKYLVGCDGAHSAVRHILGAAFKGGAYPQDFVLADGELDWGGAADEAHIFLPAQGLFTVLPLGGLSSTPSQNGLPLPVAPVAGAPLLSISGPSAPATGHSATAPLQRIICAGADLGARGTADPTLEEVQALIDRLCPVPMRLRNPTWLARFHLHHRGVDRYRFGRVFLAGDAAHIHSPAGGQGMNTGIQDSFNLAWKLAMVLRGEAGEAVLDSYHDERYPIGRALLRFTDRLFSVGAAHNSVVLRVRQALGPRLLAFASATPGRRAWLFRFISELGINYRQSTIVGEDFGDGAWRHGPLAGDRAPDGKVRLGPSGQWSTLHASLTGTKFHLVCFAGEQPTATVRASLGSALSSALSPLAELHVVTRAADRAVEALVDPDGALHRRYGVSRAATYVIRPDGYIEFRAPRIEPATPAARLLGQRAPPAVRA